MVVVVVFVVVVFDVFVFVFVFVCFLDRVEQIQEDLVFVQEDLVFVQDLPLLVFLNLMIVEIVEIVEIVFDVMKVDEKTLANLMMNMSFVGIVVEEVL